MEQLLTRGMVLTPAGTVPGEVWMHDGVIAEVRPTELAGDEMRWVCPGSIDLQINGASGVDVGSSPDRIDELAARLPAEGTTAFLPTVITCSEQRRGRALAEAGRWRTDEHSGDRTVERAGDRTGAVPLGLHLEGPVLSPARRGAHPAEHLGHAATGASENWTTERGVSMVTIAPELPGALELIAELAAAGVVVALGHTDATADEFQAGLDAGATHVTHLFNAMRPFGHRDPGPIGVTLADDTVTVGLICDLVHVDPVAIRMAWRALGPDRITLVTDAVATRGSGSFPDGIRTAEGVLAGSALTLDVAVHNLVAVTGAAVPDAVRTVASTPARVLGLVDRGVLEVGARADVTVLDHELRVVATYVGGRPAWPSAAS
jgi:N-acetylglucosamine-6-phosphate deacetylase